MKSQSEILIELRNNFQGKIRKMNETEDDTKLTCMSDIRSMVKKQIPEEISKKLLDEMYANREADKIRRTKYRNLWNELKQLLESDGNLEVLELMSELEKPSNIEDVFNNNRDQLIELAESNTVRNDDGLTVLTDEE